MLIEELLEIIVPYISRTLELIGVVIIAIAALRSVYKLIINGFNFNREDIGIDLAKAMTLSLEFKLAAEIINTVIIKSLDEFIILASVAILRIVLSFVLNWEIQSGARTGDDGGKVKNIEN